MAKPAGTKKDYNEEIIIPSGIESSIENHILTLKKEGKELTRVLDEDLSVSKKDDKIILDLKKAGKREKKKFFSLKSHIKNMIDGLINGYEYELEICNVHFPITATLDKAKSEILVKNMLGEKCPRVVPVRKNVEVEIKAPKIKLKSFDLEAVGQTAANLEKITKIRNRDRNKFQDGIFITKKPGVEFI